LLLLLVVVVVLVVLLLPPPPPSSVRCPYDSRQGFLRFPNFGIRIASSTYKIRPSTTC
jgi:hypothetical protein